jgi:hypothetical protein
MLQIKTFVLSGNTKALVLNRKPSPKKNLTGLQKKEAIAQIRNSINRPLEDKKSLFSKKA